MLYGECNKRLDTKQVSHFAIASLEIFWAIVFLTNRRGTERTEEGEKRRSHFGG
ncbi:hypothetical protein [Tolypothrix sp. VBCCA 56010]|uniref:hypothetical protein n=1 Tax=Tolypothrix sp. VBCCA 56010 TaxID=3137731 RepID=UPI003D7D2F61